MNVHTVANNNINNNNDKTYNIVEFKLLIVTNRLFKYNITIQIS